MTLLLVAALTGLMLFAALIVLGAVAATSLKSESSRAQTAPVFAGFDGQSMARTMKAA